MIAAAFLALFIHSAPQDLDTYGKSNAEILKMGREAWFKFYTSKAGDSQAAMNNAYGVYGDIASRRNDQLLSDPHLPKRLKLKKLRKLLVNFGGDMIAVGSAETSGGTMWDTITEQQYAETEETVYGVIHPMGQPKPKHAVVSDVTKLMATIPTKLKRAEEIGELTSENCKSARDDLEEARQIYRQIVQIAATFDRATSDRILNHCRDQVKLLDNLH